MRLTVRRMMALTAIPALACCMTLGVANLIASIGHALGEWDFREGAAVWEAKQEAGHAATWRALAEQQARFKRECLSRGLTTLGLIGLGVGLGGFGLVIRRRTEPDGVRHADRIASLGAACLACAKILFASLVIAGILYVGMILLIVAGDD